MRAVGARRRDGRPRHRGHRRDDRHLPRGRRTSTRRASRRRGARSASRPTRATASSAASTSRSRRARSSASRSSIVALAGGTRREPPVDVYARDPPRAASLPLRARASRRVLGDDAARRARSRSCSRAIGFDADVGRCDGARARASPPTGGSDVVAEVDLDRGGRAPARLRRASGRDCARSARAPCPTRRCGRRSRTAARGARRRRAARGAPDAVRRRRRRTHVRVRNPLAENEAHLRAYAARVARAPRRVQPRAHAGQRPAVRDRLGVRAAARTRCRARRVRVAVLVMGDRGRRTSRRVAEPTDAYDAWDAKALAERVARVAFAGRRRRAASRSATDERAVDDRCVDGSARGDGAPRRARRAGLGGAGVRRRARARRDVEQRRRAAGRVTRTARTPAAAAPAHAPIAPLPTTPAAEFDLALLVPDARARRRGRGGHPRRGGRAARAARRCSIEYRGQGVDAGHRAASRGG